LLLVCFSALFALGGWVEYGNPPKPFAHAEGFYVSGIGLQTIGALLISLGLFSGRLGLIEHAFHALWRLAGVAILTAFLIVFVWATARYLFSMASFPPASFAGSRSETWWIETAMALAGVAFSLSIPTLLRWQGHVAIDALNAFIPPPVARTIRLAGSLLLAWPVGWVLLTKGTVFAARAWQQGEGSQNFGIEFVFLVKTLVPLLGFLILVAAALNARDAFRGEEAGK